MISFAGIRKYVLMGALLAFPLVLIYAQKRNPRIASSLSVFTSDVGGSLQSVVISLFGTVADFFYFTDLVKHDSQENLRLRALLEERFLMSSLLRDAEIENTRLRSALESADRYVDASLLIAHVIGRQGSPLSRKFRIDVGAKDGVAKGDAVVHKKGAVGQVIVVGDHSSEVMLITDVASAIDVLIERSRIRGMLKGTPNTGRYQMRVQDFDRLGDIKEGDQIVTSGIGAKFPTGVPVGKVTKTVDSKDGMYIEANIDPYVAFGTLEDVFVLTQNNRKHPWTRQDLSSALLKQNLKKDS